MGILCRAGFGMWLGYFRDGKLHGTSRAYFRSGCYKVENHVDGLQHGLTNVTTFPNDHRFTKTFENGECTRIVCTKGPIEPPVNYTTIDDGDKMIDAAIAKELEVIKADNKVARERKEKEEKERKAKKMAELAKLKGNALLRAHGIHVAEGA